MSLSNIPRNATFADNDGWRRLTTDHVRTYWRSFGEYSPIYIGRVVTLFSSEEWEPQSPSAAGSVEEFGAVTIRYSQEIAFRKRTEVDPYPGFMDTDIATVPFQQNPQPYVTALATLFNNTVDGVGPFIFLDDSGLATDPFVRTGREVTTIAVTVTLVSLALIVATACVLYQTHFKHRKGESSAERDGNVDPPIVGAIIGVNENVLISESYDEDFDGEIYSSPSKPIATQPPSDPGDGDDTNIPVISISDGEYISSDDGDAEDIMAAPGEDGAFPTLSEVHDVSPDDVRMLRDQLHENNTLPYRSSGEESQSGQDATNIMDMSPLGSSPPRRTPQQGSGSDDDSEGNLNETDESTIPFMGFQMEIRDLE